MHSQTIAELAKALSLAQSEMGVAKKDSPNPFFKSKYADLASTWAACRDALTKNGLSVAQVIGGTTEAPLLTTMLLHSSGEWIRSDAPLFLQKHDPQGLGSSISYMRRYALAAIVGVYSEDDDAQKAMGQPVPKPMPIVKNYAPHSVPHAAPEPLFSDEMPPGWGDEPMPEFHHDAAPSSSQSLDGDYQINFGKYAGKRIKDISIPPLKGYVSYLRGEAEKSNKPLSGKVAEFIAAAEKYLS